MLQKLAASLLFFAAFQAHSVDPLTLINSTPGSCVDWKFKGMCSPLVPIPRIEHNIPVAYVEVMPGATQTLLDVNIPPLMVKQFTIDGMVTGSVVGQNSSGGTNNTFESSALLVSKLLWETSRHAILRKPFLCPFESAFAPFSVGELASVWDQIKESDTCPLPNPAAFFSGDTVFLTKGYSTSGDVNNWRTGCRDKGASNAIMEGKINCVAGVNIGGGPADACVGRWGSLYPRQMREIGLDTVTASAKTAYRALSNGRSTGYLPFRVDPGLIFAQTSPKYSQCFPAGTNPLPTQASGAARPVSVSSSGKYGYVVWRRVSCCVAGAPAAMLLPDF